MQRNIMYSVYNGEHIRFVWFRTRWYSTIFHQTLSRKVKDKTFLLQLLYDTPHRLIIFNYKRKHNIVLLLFPFINVLAYSSNQQYSDSNKGSFN